MPRLHHKKEGLLSERYLLRHSSSLILGFPIKVDSQNRTPKNNSKERNEYVSSDAPPFSKAEMPAINVATMSKAIRICKKLRKMGTINFVINIFEGNMI